MDELHQQTVNLLSFQPLPKDVFDAQVAFNMVARYGQKSQPALDSVEARILASLPARLPAPMPAQPSLMLLQAPIFHGHALALFLEMESCRRVCQLCRKHWPEIMSRFPVPTKIRPATSAPRGKRTSSCR